MPKSRITYLVNAYIAGSLSDEEREELWTLVQKEEQKQDLSRVLRDYLSSLPADTTINKQALQHIWKNAISVDKNADRQHEVSESERPHGVSRSGPRLVRMWRWIAAACIILLLGISTYVILGEVEGRHKEQLTATTNDVQAPKETKAVITLADGSKVYLDSVNGGTLAQQGNTNVIKTEDGRILYNANGQQLTANSSVYNTLTNPRGSKVIDMQLSDGSHVWLNAGSSVKYPVAFVGNEREVEITGEAYFEVKHISKQPFRVHLPNGSIVEDVGTAFNVNAYSDESDIKTTLIEGAVNIFASSAKTSAPFAFKLKPGQQAVINNPSNNLIEANKNKNPLDNPVIRVQNNVNMDEVLAWKNGKFVFSKTDIQTTMRQLARWYDVDIEYSGNVSGFFIGSIPRKENASQVLKMLEMTGAAHFRIEGRKIIIMP